jgi:hypothetical protein
MEGVFPIPQLAGSMFVGGNGAYLRCVVLAAKFVAQKMVTQPRDRNVWIFLVQHQWVTRRPGHSLDDFFLARGTL